MKYLIVKIHTNNNSIEYGKMFDSETDAIEQAAKLNESARKNDWADIVRFTVLPEGAK